MGNYMVLHGDLFEKADLLSIFNTRKEAMNYIKEYQENKYMSNWEWEELPSWFVEDSLQRDPEDIDNKLWQRVKGYKFGDNMECIELRKIR